MRAGNQDNCWDEPHGVDGVVVSQNCRDSFSLIIPWISQCCLLLCELLGVFDGFFFSVLGWLACFLLVVWVLGFFDLFHWHSRNFILLRVLE